LTSKWPACAKRDFLKACLRCQLFEKKIVFDPNFDFLDERGFGFCFILTTRMQSFIVNLSFDNWSILCTAAAVELDEGGEGKKWGKKERKERFDSRCTLIVYWLEGEFRHQMVSPWPNFDYIFLPVSFFFRFDRKKMLDIWFFFKLGSLFSVYES
jgi:hypothetical protein